MTGDQPASPLHGQHLTATLILGCLAQFMVILDVSVVNVALPSIRHALDFSESDLQWVVNAYTVTFAGCLLLGGRAADLLGRRRVFVAGLTLFSISSLAGGFADSRTVLIIARLIQGFGAAIVAPASLSILTSTFTEPRERHRAIGAWGATGGAGGAAGVLLGGIIVQALTWRWILFINVPIGLVAALVAQRMLTEGRNEHATRNFDLAGALSVTAGLSLLVFGIVRTDGSGWGDTTTLLTIGLGLALLVLFVLIEGRLAKAPLVPLRLFRSRRLSAANGVILLLGAATFCMWFFFSLYLQEVLGDSPLMTGFIFLPMSAMLITASDLASRITRRVGIKRLTSIGMVVLTAGLVLFTRLRVGSGFLSVILPAEILTSIGMAFAYIPGVIAATAGVSEREAGLASALANNARLFGGALGLAVLATLASSYTESAMRHPSATVHTLHQALAGGFELAFWIAAAISAVGALVAMVGLPHAEAAAVSQTESALALEA